MVKIEIFNKENFVISCHSCHIRHLLWFRMIYPFFERSLLRAQEVAKLNARSCHTVLFNAPTIHMDERRNQDVEFSG